MPAAPVPSSPVIALLLLHLGLALAAPALAPRLRARVLYVCAVAPATAFVWMLANLGSVTDRSSRSEIVDWVPAMGLRIELRLDAFSLLFAAIVSGVGVAVFVYARSYMADHAGIGRFAAAITAFAGSMLGVVLADNLLLLYVFWELTSVTSYLLIGTDHQDATARSSALRALLITGAGGLAMLAGFVVIGQAGGTFRLSALISSPPTGIAVGAGAVLVLVGAATKSAQFPFHSWLPGAMAAPTPVSAYLHSATMVKAGVYLLARLAPALGAVLAFWRPTVMTLGSLTMLVGGYLALREHDLKLLLAYGTVSQLGFMVVLVGAGRPELTFAGVAVILAHSLFKAVLFMVAGIVDHHAHTRDIRRLRGLGRELPLVMAVAAVAAASMAGIAPLLGFVAKEAALEALLHDGTPVTVAAVVAGSALTVAYGARFVFGAFGGAPVIRGDAGSDERPSEAQPTHGGRWWAGAPLLVIPAALLAALTLVWGVAPGAAGKAVAEASRALDPAVEQRYLVLWHGFTPALALSLLAIAGGVALFLVRGQVERTQRALEPQGGFPGIYEAALRGLNRVADRTTGVLQNGSLPIYAGVILSTVVAVPAWHLVSGFRMPAAAVIAESPLQLVVAAGAVVAAVACARSQRRFAAVLLLGSVGFLVAVLFVIQGAPDVALTQLLIETLALVMFVLVLRHLPEQFEGPQWQLGTAVRLVISGGVGIVVVLFAIVSAGTVRSSSTSTELVARSLPEGGGRNVVNVILTDFRALDTLGEITVLVVAALGIATLVRVGRHGTAATDIEGEP